MNGLDLFLLFAKLTSPRWLRLNEPKVSIYVKDGLIINFFGDDGKIYPVILEESDFDKDIGHLTDEILARVEQSYLSLNPPA